MFVADLMGVSTAEQRFHVEFVVTVTWKDPRIASKTVGKRVYQGNELWHPRYIVRNQVLLRRNLPEVIEVDSEGNARHVQFFTGKLTTKLDLKEFPFDRHELQIEVYWLSHGPDELEVTMNEGLGGTDQDYSVLDWAGSQPRSEVGIWRHGVSGVERVRMQTRIEIERYIDYYILKAYLPLMLIVLMSWAVFWIHPVHLGPQISVSITAMLTLIAYQFALGNMLPKVPYLTRSDAFTTGSTLLVFLSFLEAILTGMIADRDRGKLANRIDIHSRWVFPLAFFGVVYFSLLR